MIHTAAMGRVSRVRDGALHPAVWLVWFAAGLVMTMLTSNPLYHATIALAAIVVYAAAREGRPRAFDALLVVGVLFATLTIPLNLVTGSTGPTELFPLPSAALPGWLGHVQLGGAVTAESLLYAADSALALIALICLACAFNASVDHFRLLKLVPPAFAQLGIIVTVGLVLIPETIAAAAATLEARTVRGHRMTLAAVPGLLAALLGQALERSVQRAESLEARGFGSLSDPPRAGESLLALSALAVLTGSGFAWFYAPDARLIWALSALPAAILLAVVAWRMGSRGTAVRLFMPSFTTADALVIAFLLAGVLAFFALRASGAAAITYLPFPTATVPPFHPIAAICCLLLLTPLPFVVHQREVA